jgi:hypothetical protein
VCGGGRAGCAACDVAPGSKAKAAAAADKPAAAAGAKAWNAFELGYGSLHPKFLEASKKPLVTASKRARSPPVRSSRSTPQQRLRA